MTGWMKSWTHSQLFKKEGDRESAWMSIDNPDWTQRKHNSKYKNIKTHFSIILNEGLFCFFLLWWGNILRLGRLAVFRKLVVFLLLRSDPRWKLFPCPFPETTFFSSSLTSADPTTRKTHRHNPHHSAQTPTCSTCTSSTSSTLL